MQAGSPRSGESEERGEALQAGSPRSGENEERGEALQAGSPRSGENREGGEAMQAGSLRSGGTENEEGSRAEQPSQPSTPLSSNEAADDPSAPHDPVVPSKTGIPQRRLTNISISDVQNTVQLKTLESRVVEQLTQERLEELWNELIERNKDDEKFCNLLADKKVELKNNNLFHIQVPNMYFDSLFRDVQTRILEFLREETGNESLQFKVAVVVEHVERKAYLPREKFDEMVKVNPAILSLRKLFPDIDF